MSTLESPFNKPGLWTIAGSGSSSQAVGMPYFLEYLTDLSAGCFMVEGLDFNHALAKAKDALRGLECISATLLFTPHSKPTFGTGSVIAAFTKDEGWRFHDERPD